MAEQTEKCVWAPWFRLATLAFTTGPKESVSNVLSTFVSDVLRHSRISPYHPTEHAGGVPGRAQERLPANHAKHSERGA